VQGLALLDDTARLAQRCGLSHQLRVIPGVTVTDQHRADAKLIWDYHQLRPCSAGIGLGSHDLGVATLAADLYHAGLFPVLVFSGGNSPTAAARFPRGEAVHYVGLAGR
jgi:hypothetical protein